jgi:hypothetical protein
MAREWQMAERAIRPISIPKRLMLVCFGLCIQFNATFPAVVASHEIPARITSPKEYFGFNLGDDYCLANYRQLAGYWARLEKESSRLKVVCIGATEEGRPQLMGVVTSPANHRELARYQDIARRLARVEGVAEAEAKALSAEGKAVVWIDGGLHASETLCPQMLIETLYQFVSADDAETQRILDDVIILFVHANPDGNDLVSDWYMRDPDPNKRSLAGLPRLYQKYIGHDNNRDFYASTQAETKNMNRVMYHEWLPQIVYNHHQSGPAGTVLFCPPFRDPFNYNIDPLVVSGIDAVGAAMMHRFLAENKPGATSRSGARYSTWWNGGLRTTCYFHNMIGLLTETVGSPTPMQIPFNPSLQLPRADYLAPIEPQTWHLRQSVEYSVTANRAVLDYASRHRQKLLYNIWLMGKNAIERGSRDHWTITPKIVEAAKAARGGDSAAKGQAAKASGADQFRRHFRDPEKRDPRGYVIPSDQPDFLTATKFVNALLDTGVRVHRARSEFQVAGKTYPAGSYVVKCSQPFRAHVLDMFEPQDHPSDFAYSGAPPTAPYDIAGWTLAYQMAVQFDRILDGCDGPFEEVFGPLPSPPGRLVDAAGAAGFLLDPRMNDSFRAVNRLLAAGHEVRRLRAAFSAGGKEFAPGSFYIPSTSSTPPLLERIAFDLGTPFVGVQVSPGSETVTIKPVRVGLWDRYGGSMPSGWTRWLLERFEFPFQVVFPPELDKGDLREKFDVLIFVDGAIPSLNASTERGRGQSGATGGDQPPAEDRTSAASENISIEYLGRRGSVTATKTVPQLKQFLESGGTILTIGTSTNLAQHLSLPLTNHLVATDKDGKEQPLAREKFYVPGSLLRVHVDSSNPLAWGMSETADVMFSASPTYRLRSEMLEEGESSNGSVQKIAWFDSTSPLRSGWAWGQEHLAGGIAIAEAEVGSGRLVLFGPQILFRAQPHGTFKFLFNGIVQAGMADEQIGGEPKIGRE